MKYTLIGLLLFLFTTAQAKDKYLAYHNILPSNTLSIENKVFLASDNKLYIQEKDSLKELFTSGEHINTFQYWQNNLLIATNKGIIVYNEKQHSVIDTILKNEKVNCLTVDVANHLWIGTQFGATYSLNNIKETPNIQLNTNGINTITSTSDSNVYVGSNVGMYQININTGQLIRYAEEGYSGYDLPDNIVEHLFADAHGNVWVLMPDNIAYKGKHTISEDLPSYAYIGSKNNEVYSIIEIGNDHSYIFITKEKPILLPSKSLKEDSNAGNKEIFQQKNINAWVLNDKIIEKPLQLKDEAIINATSTEKDILFFTKDGAWSISKSKILKNLKKM